MSKTNAEAVAAVTETLPSGEAAPEPVKVELPPEEPAEATSPPAPAPAPATAPEKPKIRNRPNERITTLANEKMSLMQELELERRRSSELANKLAQSEAEISASQLRQMELHKARLTTDAQAARDQLKKANQEKNDDLLADATARLARAESGLADVEAWEARHKTAPKETPQAPPQQRQEQPRQEQPQQRQAEPQFDPATTEWMTSNPWFQPNSPEFNKSMHLTAVAYASRLEDRMRAEGKENEIAGPAYWDEIDRYMAREFPDQYEGGEEPPAATAPPPPAPPRQSSPVAPAARSQPSSTGKTPAGGRVLAELSSQERQIADSLRNAGALVYPKDHPKVQQNPALRGQRMSPEDSYIAYAVQIRKDKADQAQRMANR